VRSDAVRGVCYRERFRNNTIRGDQIRDPFRSVGSGPILVAEHVKLCTFLVLATRKQPEPETLLGLESKQEFRRIEGRAENVGTESLEFGSSITEPLPLQRSPPGVGLRKPPENDPPAGVIGESYLDAVLVEHGEGRCGCAWFEHRRHPTCAASRAAACA
jgi:hypothetical protein